MKICFVLLHSLHSLYLSEALYAIYHSKVEQDYLRMRRDSQGPDPLELTNDLRRIQLCDKVLKANAYFYVYHSHSDEFDAAGRSRMSSRGKKARQQSVNRRNAQLRHFNSLASASDAAFKYRYNVKYVLVGTVPTRMRVFLCSEGKKAELFVTFGFQDEYAFLLTRPKKKVDDGDGDGDDSSAALKIRAMLAPTPKLNTEISFVMTKDHRRVLDNYFWQFFQGRPNYSRAHYYHVLEFMQLCWLADDEYRYFDVCSSVANTLTKHTQYRDLHLEIAKSNYVKKISNSVGCVDRLLLDNRTGDKVNVRVLPCTVNRNNWSQPQFYLLRDPNLNFPSSVFVLKPHHRTVGVLTLDAYINNVSALTSTRHSNSSSA